MSKIENVQLPHNQRGNDPADYIGEPGYLGNLKVIELDEKPTQIQPDTEDDLGLIFSKKYRERLRYVAQMGRWFLWDGRTWVQDQILEVFDLVRRLCRECFTEESGLRKKMLTAGTIAAIERLVRSGPTGIDRVLV